MSPNHIVAGNTKVNTLYVSYIFNTKHGLEDLTKEEYDAAGLLDDDIEGSKEERTFRIWINSLDLENVYINNLIEECNDGVIIAKVMHKIDDKVIEWKKIDMAPKNDFNRNINNNTCIDGGKKMKLKLVGIGGVDLTKKHRKLTLALIWQLVRAHYLHLIGDKTEVDLVNWANSVVAGKANNITSLKDKSMGDGKFLL